MDILPFERRLKTAVKNYDKDNDNLNVCYINLKLPKDPKMDFIPKQAPIRMSNGVIF
jgi:hypothetical protein